MRSIGPMVVLFTALVIGCTSKPKEQFEIAGPQSQVVKEIIDAVNQKDPQKYVAGFADNVQVYVESNLKINGRRALMLNRQLHFERHPNLRSEIQHLVEIDNRVILHDKVWLEETDQEGQDIVEIFTFENQKVVRIDVIQSYGLFQNSTKNE